jgi:hypothetical protein
MVRFHENCKTADFELCKKGGAQFCRPKIFNLYFLYRLKKIWFQLSDYWISSKCASFYRQWLLNIFILFTTRIIKCWHESSMMYNIFDLFTNLFSETKHFTVSSMKRDVKLHYNATPSTLFNFNFVFLFFFVLFWLSHYLKSNVVSFLYIYLLYWKIQNLIHIY